MGLLECFNDSLKCLNHNFKMNLDLKYRNKKMVTRNNDLKNKLTTNDYDKYKNLYIEQNDLDLKLYNYLEETSIKIRNDIKKSMILIISIQDFLIATQRLE